MDCGSEGKCIFASLWNKTMFVPSSLKISQIFLNTIKTFKRRLFCSFFKCRSSSGWQQLGPICYIIINNQKRPLWTIKFPAIVKISKIKTMKPCQTAKIMYHTINTIYNAQTLKLLKSSPPCIIIFHWQVEIVIRSGKNMSYWKTNERNEAIDSDFQSG